MIKFKTYFFLIVFGLIRDSNTIFTHLLSGAIMTKQIKENLIVALDLPTTMQAEELVNRLGDSVTFYKIGLALMPIGGIELARRLKQAGKKIFLDLKLFDISYTIENTIKNLNQFDIDFLTVHGDPHVVRAACEINNKPCMKILAGTLLTSLDRRDLNEALIKDGTVEDLVVQRARNALIAGADGVIASPNESKRIRSLTECTGRLIVTPGVRLAHNKKNDQKRVSDPTNAFKNGSDFIVVGRPILNSENPLEEVKRFQL